MAWFWVLLTVCLWGVAPIIDKLALVKLDPLLGVFIRGTTTMTFSLIFLGVGGKLKGLAGADPRSVALVAFSGLIASMLAQWTYFKVLKMGNASQVVPLCATYPLVAAVLGFLVLREKATPERLAGIVLVVAGIYLIRR